MRKEYEVLKNIYGYTTFRGSQEPVIDHTLKGGSSLVVMPTGAGKSLCYQIPAQVLEGVGLVISPLIALMEDQVQALRGMGVKAAYLNSTLTEEEEASVQREAGEGRLDLLFVAPERVATESFQRFISTCKLSLIAVDEAHCVSQWGHDFRPDYLSLKSVFEGKPVVAYEGRVINIDLRLSYLRPALLSNLSSPHPEEVDRSRISCPNCHKEMRREGYSEENPLLVDRCGDCNSIWLDDGELGHLFEERVKKHPHPRPGFVEGLRRLVGMVPRVASPTPPQE